ncbi:14130_t:CDS:2 [Funneliformis geosporum]|uniref:79_t:CDS:1 n=1 Tax=Funneliformis geosporum TaxID=1117311 RepID=A0A9W4SKM1_9GLOM|nr:14130_t:CDS:2 [Funneliformis geosporum]CAI2172561.1 79_t:CDS:2 [Funneliformis geosporum]
MNFYTIYQYPHCYSGLPVYNTQQPAHYTQPQYMNQIFSDYPLYGPQVQLIYDPPYQVVLRANASMFVSYQSSLRFEAPEFVPQAVNVHPQQYPHHQSTFLIDAPDFIPKTANRRPSFVPQTQRELRVETPEFIPKSPRNKVFDRKIAITRQSQVSRKLDAPNDLKESQRTEVRKDFVNANEDDGDDEEREEVREERRKVPRELSALRKEVLKNHRNKTKLRQRKKKRIEANPNLPALADATKAPCEIFMEICIYLSPSDLYSLTRVCKIWRNWLVAPNNTRTQKIWSDSRKYFINRVKNPPIGVDEFKWYIQRWRKVPDWIMDCYFCFNKKAKKSCKFKRTLVKACKHCHDFYSRRARKKYPNIYNSLNSLKPVKPIAKPRRRRRKCWW